MPSLQIGLRFLGVSHRFGVAAPTDGAKLLGSSETVVSVTTLDEGRTKVCWRQATKCEPESSISY